MDDNDLLPSRKKLKVILDSDNESEDSFSVSVTKPSLEKTKESKFVVKKSMISKTEDENIPLPDPFELPKNFRPDVASALKLGKMTLSTNRAFLSSIASAMVVYKKYPSSDDYINVARTIVNRYPFMKSPTGKPYVSSI